MPEPRVFTADAERTLIATMLSTIIVRPIGPAPEGTA
jgi:hypothetical protein